MFGVVDGVHICQQDRTTELSKRMYERNIPSEPLKPELSMRPQQTKFTVLGKSQPLRNTPCTPPQHYANYTPTKIFNPGNARAPWHGYVVNVNAESTLRNQFFALQDCDQGKYIPATTSDLYEAKITSRPTTQPYPGLFKQEDFEPFQPNCLGIAKNIFHNHTSQQLKDT